MSSNRKRSTGRTVVLGALLLLAATASGCGVGLPTAPDVESSQVQGRGATAASATQESPFEVDDGLLPGTTPEDVVPAEVVVPTPTSTQNGNAWAKGHLNEKWIKRHGG